MRHQCTEIEWFPNPELGQDDPMRCQERMQVLGWNKATCPCGLPSTATLGVGLGTGSVTSEATAIWPCRWYLGLLESSNTVTLCPFLATSTTIAELSFKRWNQLAQWRSNKSTSTSPKERGFWYFSCRKKNCIERNPDKEVDIYLSPRWIWTVQRWPALLVFMSERTNPATSARPFPRVSSFRLELNGF